MKAGPGALIEREGELRTAGSLLDDVATGEGGAASVEGPAGIGKSALLAEIRAAAGDRGFAVHAARGSELEIEFAFGVVRQLFEAAATSPAAEEAFAGAAEPARELFAAAASPTDAEPSGNVSFSILHGLFWTTFNLAGDGPLLLVVDDLHWCDRPSLRFLAYLIHRLEGTRIGVLTARRSNEPGVDAALMGGVSTAPGTVLLSPSPLSVDGVGELVERRFEQAPDPSFAAACERASGGNPLLLEQTVRALVREGRKPVASDVEAIIDLGPRAVSRAIAARMSALPERAGEAARAIATLGDGSDITEIAAFTGLAEADVAASTAALARAGVLEQDALAFAHPLVRAAIVESVPVAERQLAHSRAAQLFFERGVSPERIAAQLLAAPPIGEPWAADALDRAAKVAAASGAIDSAATYMSRRLREPIEEAELPGLQLQLGMAEAGTGADTAVDHLERAYETLAMPELRVVAAYALGRVLLFQDQAARCARLAAAARAELAEQVPTLVPIVESVELISVYFGADVPGAARRFEELRRLPEDPTPGDCVLAAAASYDWLYRGGSAEECAELATRAIDLAQQMEVDTGLTWIVANVVLVAAERPEAMERWDQALARSHAQGGMFGVMSVHLWRGFTELHHGELPDAESSLRAGVEQITLLGGGGTLGYAYGLLASTLLAQGRVDEAEKALWMIGERPADGSDSALLWRVAEVELLLARGRNEEALAAARDHVEACGWRVNPAFAPGRRLQAQALLALGRRDEAEALMLEDLELAELWGAPGTVGSTLARLAPTRGSDAEAIAELERAVGLLERSPRRLELARALASLGAALRRDRRPSEAREPLRRAYELAEACGAGDLVASVRTELHASGARPRTSALSGPESLTASERRVADLAAEGKTNKEIAQALFVTPKTVEVHLSNTYRKLDISGRRELSSALI